MLLTIRLSFQEDDAQGLAFGQVHGERDRIISGRHDDQFVVPTTQAVDSKIAVIVRYCLSEVPTVTHNPCDRSVGALVGVSEDHSAADEALGPAVEVLVPDPRGGAEFGR